MTSPSPVSSADQGLELTEEFVRALQLLDSQSNIFLTGKAGTGKSTLIRHFMDRTDRHVVVVAPTGIAALNVGGYTIHRLFSFGASTTLDDVRAGRYYPGRFAKVLKNLDTLIIDEVSMVRADMLDQIAVALERFGPNPGQPFGGVQIVLVGDLFQLPPVVKEGEKEWLTAQFGTPYFFSAKAFSNEAFSTVSLTKIFRQRGDVRLTELLNAVREGVLVDHMRGELNTRTDPDFVPPEDEFWLTVAPTNTVVTSRNRRALERLSSPEYQHNSASTGDVSMFDTPVEDALRFKVGAQVMLLNNDAAGRWVNGSLGKIIDIDDGGETVLITLNDGDVVAVEPHTWEVSQPVIESGKMRRDLVGTYTQLPFKLAWATTIHKCQGQTLDRVIVDFSGGVFDYGQAYVALSRCTSMDGLVLKRNVLAKDLKTDRRILRFLHSATTTSGPRRYCAIGVLTVGSEGRMDRPRPLEIAIAFEDGTTVSTLLNPERDLSGAREQYGITVDDVLLAPTLGEAWPVLAAILAGYTPVGVGLDQSLGLLDFELKRLGIVQHLPLANDIPDSSLTPTERKGMRDGSALERARAALAAHKRLRNEDAGASAFDIPDDEPELTYLLSRDHRESPPKLSRGLAVLLAMSRAVSAAILEGETVKAGADGVEGKFVREIVTSRLASSAEKSAGLPPTIRQRLATLAPFLGTAALEEIAVAQEVSPHEILGPGVRVCFTGDAVDLRGRAVTKDELHGYCERVGLVPVNNVTKTRCDVLVVAELGTQSGKARKAKDYGKPVISVEQFWRWEPSEGG